MKFNDYIKKGLVSFAVISIVIPSINASALDVNEINDKLQISESICLDNLSEDVSISEVMTYDEIVKQIADDENISVEEAKALIGEEPWRPYDEVVREISDNENISIEEAKELINNKEVKNTREGLLVRANTYRTLKTSVTVTTTYKPTINWYCSTSESGNFHGIVKIIRTSLNRSYNGISKQFSGELYSKLEQSDRIYYELNGDFYNNGTTTVSGTGSAEMNKVGSVSFSVSYASNHYKYCFKTGRYRW